MQTIFGMGNPLMDTILSGSTADLVSLNVVPGSMNLVTFETQQEVVRSCRKLSQLPGGSCSNTVRASAWISSNCGGDAIRTIYLGAIGTDGQGDLFELMLREQGVESVLVRKETPTGTSVIVVTPDFERTMFTYLGACRELNVDDLNRRAFEGTTVFHTTGYMWDTPNQEEAADAAVAMARDEGATISLDIADPFVADRYRDRLREWMPGNVDLLFANRQELYSLTGAIDDDSAMKVAGAFAPQVVMKTGAEGCLVQTADGRIRVPGVPVQAKDTTGAGDAFAGGYLYGVVCGWEPRRCAVLANTIAAGMCTVEGCRYDQMDAAWVSGGSL